MADSFDGYWDPHTDRDHRILLYELNLPAGKVVKKPLEPVRINGKFHHIEEEWLTFEVDGVEFPDDRLFRVGVQVQLSVLNHGGSERHFLELLAQNNRYPTVRVYITIPREATDHKTPDWLSKGTLPV